MMSFGRQLQSFAQQNQQHMHIPTAPPGGGGGLQQHQQQHPQQQQMQCAMGPMGHQQPPGGNNLMMGPGYGIPMGVSGTSLAPPPHQSKEPPSLMPVPSPHQIQYLNAFDDQELTIQKQPNTSLRDGEILSP